MKRISRPVLGFISALIGGIAVFATVQLTLLGREPNPPVKLSIQDTPVNRQVNGVSYAPILKHAAPSVVNIYSTRTVQARQSGRFQPMPPVDDPFFRQFFGDDRGGGQSLPRKEQGLGSGVVVSADGYILTANHVVEGADPNGVKVALASGGKTYTARIIGADSATDIAVLKIDAEDLSAITLADSDKIEVGDVVMAIGNPFGIGQTVTVGIVSAMGRTSLGIIREGPLRSYENFIQTDAAINQGNSGGALIDAEGRLVGINTAIVSPSGGNAGIGFAVPVNLARNVMERLIQYGKVTRGFLGVGLQLEITPDLAEEFNLPDTSGAMVTDVRPDSSASKAGLQSGDVIRAVDGRKITDGDQLRLMISQIAPGTKVTLKILRSEAGRRPVEKTITATLGALRPEEMANRNPRIDPAEDNSSATADALDGVEVTDLDADSRRQFNIPNNVNGALITRVEPDSNSAEAGLHPGDVILEIKRQPVRNAEDAVELSKNVKGNRVVLRVWRGGAGFFITVNNEKEK